VIGLMDNGELITVPASIEAGDVVCILQGSYSPCALRTHQDGTWTLISGDCYIWKTELYAVVGDYLTFMSEEYIESNKERVETFRIR
jgi:hypothetical protein